MQLTQVQSRDLLQKQALEAENALRRVEFEAQQKVTQATAEAKGLELQKGAGDAAAPKVAPD